MAILTFDGAVVNMVTGVGAADSVTVTVTAFVAPAESRTSMDVAPAPTPAIDKTVPLTEPLAMARLLLVAK